MAKRRKSTSVDPHRRKAHTRRVDGKLVRVAGSKVDRHRRR